MSGLRFHLEMTALVHICLLRRYQWSEMFWFVKEGNECVLAPLVLSLETNSMVPFCGKDGNVSHRLVVVQLDWTMVCLQWHRETVKGITKVPGNMMDVQRGKTHHSSP